jgi:DNA recombination protein RmuC
MLDHCDFFEQQSGDGPLRPDMIVRLPHGRSIVVDAKVPMEAYLTAMEAKDEATREAKLDEHVQKIREHMSALSSRSYRDQFKPGPELVFMFLPGESFYSAALEQEPSLIEEGVKQGIIIATPITLIALLRTVEFGWREEKLAEHAEQIGNLGKELHDRVCTMGGHFAKLGSSLRVAVDSYNQTLGSLETRVLVSARRLKDLGASDGVREIDTVVSVDVIPRPLQKLEIRE